MKTLAAFSYVYGTDVRVFFESGWLDISTETRWFLPCEYYSNPKNIHELIEYHRHVANWVEFKL